MAYCFENNTDFIREKVSGDLTMLRKQFDSPELRGCIKSPDSALANATLVKDSRSTTAGFCKLDDNRKVFVKRYNRRGFNHILRYLFRRSRVWRAWENAWRLENNSIPAPKAIAARSHRFMGIPGRSWLVTEVLDNVVQTVKFYRMRNKDPELHREYVDAVTGMLAKLHKYRLVHGDPKLSNICVRQTGEDEFCFGFWDLDNVKSYNKPLSMKMRCRELARLISSFMDIGKRLKLKPSLESAISNFAAAYQRHTGIELDMKLLRKRIDKFMKKARRK